MRPRDEIQKDGKRKDDLILEVLLDIRELLGYREMVKVEETKPPLPIVERTKTKRRKKRKYTKRKTEKANLLG